MASTVSNAAGGANEVKKFWSNGQIKYHKKEDGAVEEFDQKGRILYRELADGTVEEHTPIEYDTFSRPEERGYAQRLRRDKNRSVMTYRKASDGLIEEYSAYDGELTKRIYPDGRKENYLGKILCENTLADGTEYHYSVYTGKLMFVTFPNDTWETYSEDGTLYKKGTDIETLDMYMPRWNGYSC